MASGYTNTSLSSYIDAVDRKYSGAVTADDAATIAIGACEAFDAHPVSAYASFTERSVTSGLSKSQADFMVRTAVEKVCPHHRSDLP